MFSRFLFFLLLLATGWLSACQSSPLSPGLTRLVADDPNWDVMRFHAPARLAGLAADGEIDGQGRRQWRYRLPEPSSVRLAVTVYALPGGWSEMTPERAVAGHYGQLRQRRLDRLVRHRDLSLSVEEETRFDLEGHASARARWHWVRDNGNRRYQALLLMRLDDHFLLLEAHSKDQNSRWLLQRLKRAQAEFRAANPSPPSTAAAE